MGEIIYLRDQHFAEFHDKCFLLLSASNHIELSRQLTKTLHHMLVTKNTPVALYHYLPTGQLRLIYYFSFGSNIEYEDEISSIRSFEALSHSQLTYYALNGEHETWGYVAHPPSSYIGSTHWISSLVDIAMHQLGLLSAKCIDRQQAKLKTSRRLLSKDIHLFTNIEEILDRHRQRWRDIFHACGICLASQGALHRFGHCPSDHQLLQQLSWLSNDAEQTDVIEFEGSHQGSLAVKLSLAGTHHGWLLLFRDQPFTNKHVDSAIHRALSCWLTYEARMARVLADDLALTIAALEISHTNRQFITTAQQLASLKPAIHSAPRAVTSAEQNNK
ncbi:hypothetical protein [Halomonas sp.]|uniref:hypothetical protein n=1 Tax=Halomonas sp. TaxID=1486246 RepID=UPI003F933F21